MANKEAYFYDENFQNKKPCLFKDFEWNKAVMNSDGRYILIERLNILYGRNYSGKTTLSRILRAMETRKISDKYENPIF